MTAEMLLNRLEAVRSRGTGKWSARCPSHKDKSPSLSIAEGERGILLKCWAGCSLQEITAKLGLSVQDLFYDGLSDPLQHREALQRRKQERAVRQAAYEAEGRRLDVLREADALIQSTRGISIDGWSDDRLHAELNRLGMAYAVLESEGR